MGDAKETATKEGLAARDGGGGGGGGGAGVEGVVPGERCGGGAPAEHRAGHRTIEPVLGSSPVTKGAKAEEKVRRHGSFVSIVVGIERRSCPAARVLDHESCVPPPLPLFCSGSALMYLGSYFLPPVVDLPFSRPKLKPACLPCNTGVELSR